MSTFVGIHLTVTSFSRRVNSGEFGTYGVLSLDRDKCVSITGTAAELRGLADELLELADDIDFQATRRAFSLPSPDELARQEETRQAQRLALLAQRLERVGGGCDD